jgi:hypothetical protein
MLAVGTSSAARERSRLWLADPPTGREYDAAAGPGLTGVLRRGLLALALAHGFSTFIIASDDPREIQLFGEEVAPALREAITRERRSAGTETGVARGPKALALRRVARHPAHKAPYASTPRTSSGVWVVTPMPLHGLLRTWGIEQAVQGRAPRQAAE